MLLIQKEMKEQIKLSGAVNALSVALDITRKNIFIAIDQTTRLQSQEGY